MRIQKLILQDIAYKEIICADEELMKNKESYDLETASIYCRMENAEFFGNEESGIKIHKGGKVSLDTYSNSFSVGKWAKYTVIDTISLLLDMEGSATVKLMHAQKEGNDIKVNEIKSFDVNNETRQKSVFDFGKLADEGIYYAEIEAKDSEVTIYGGSYDTVDMEPTQTVKLAIDICTFKREKYVKRNMGIIFHDILENEDSPLYRNLWIHISDNASSLDGIVDSNEFITVSKNANLGGVGGFTRGIIETKKRQKEMGFTHVLLMDDDATISSAAIELNYILLSYLKPEYFGHTIGGKLLVLNVPYLQFEAGAQWNKGKIKALKNDLDIRQLDMVLESEIEDKPIEYTGWWYCCIPLSEIDDNNLPLPIFIHRDDIEYDLRPGMGMAAIQLGIPKRYFVVVHEYEEKKFNTYVIINPKIVSTSTEKIYVTDGEGCLSVNRETVGITPRYARVTIEGYDMDGNKIRVRGREELAIAFQHEYDHLNGILFIDKIDKKNPFKDQDKMRGI